MPKVDASLPGETDAPPGWEGGDADRTAGPPWRSRARRLFMTTVALLLLCEATVRVVFFFHHRSEAAEISRQYPPSTYIDDFAGRQDYRFINLYTMNPERGAEGVSEYRFDAMGFRLDRRDLRFDGQDRFKHVWMLGGSTTQGLGLREGDTIAAQLNDRLEKDKSEWRVLNLGQGGFTSTQEVLLLTELVQEGLRPDALLVYDGINEVPFSGDPIRTVRSAGYSLDV